MSNSSVEHVAADPAHRTLTFSAIDQITADVEALLAGGYHRLGNWTLGQCCDHLANTMVVCLDGTDVRLNPFMRAFGYVSRGYFLKRGFPKGLKIEGTPVAESLLPKNADDQAGVDRLRSCVQRMHDQAERHPSPLFGRMSREQWDRLHLRHAEHHLAFLVPVAKSGPDSPAA